MTDDARSPAWLSLDPSDSQATTFWSYVIAALQTVAPGVGTTSLSMLREPQPPPMESILATLVNELSATSTRPVLVLVSTTTTSSTRRRSTRESRSCSNTYPRTSTW